jgi:hypothetical protein
MSAEANCPYCGGLVRLVGGSNEAQIAEQSGSNSTSNEAQISSSNSDQLSERSKIYNKGYTEPFLAFWSAYPLHRAKRQAQLSWLKSVARLSSILGSIEEAQSVILAGAIRYRDDPNREGGYTRYAATWLNGDGWEDEPLPTRISPNGRSSMYDRLGVQS